jgi:Tetracyclin repressor-like, C-terminal domain
VYIDGYRPVTFRGQLRAPRQMRAVLPRVVLCPERAAPIAVSPIRSSDGGRARGLVHQFGELAAATSATTQRSTDPVERLRAWCLAYCRFGLEHQGHYRAMFESWNAERVDLPPAELPGYGLRQSLLTAIAACGTPADDVDELGTLVWAGLHGLVSLHINKPSFPWPPIDDLVDGHLRRMMRRS